MDRPTVEVVPGGSIEPRAVEIGNLAIVGTSRCGPLHQVVSLDYAGSARDIFGEYDAIDSPEEAESPLTLVRACDLAYANGAQRIFAVRVACTRGAAAGQPATYVLAAGENTYLQAESISPGSCYNDAELTAETGGQGLNVTFKMGDHQETWRDVPASAAEFAQTINGTHPTYDYRHQSSNLGGSSLFVLDAAHAIGDVAEGTATLSATGTNGAQTVPADYAAGLDVLLHENVHIIVLAGQAASELGAILAAHCKNASSDTIGHERIGIIGSNSDLPRNLVRHGMDSSRIIFVGPGIQAYDTEQRAKVSLPGTYTAAAVAGRMACLKPHVSATNKTLRVGGVTARFSSAERERLVRAGVLALQEQSGVTRVIRAVTTCSNPTWKEVTTRRIVDFTKFGVRLACAPFMGLLNNERVRQAMKSTVNGFLADMVDREMLVSYHLSVSATREQQRRGTAIVTVILHPIFSTDYIRVVMQMR